MVPGLDEEMGPTGTPEKEPWSLVLSSRNQLIEAD